nr:MAG TPA: Radical SAM superfamily [Caudoviricetes sp.]
MITSSICSMDCDSCCFSAFRLCDIANPYSS